MLSSPARAEYTFGMSWQIITPLLLLGTGSVAMIIWYFSSNEFLDAGFPPRAAEAFRIAAVAADDWQLKHAIRHWRTGLEIAIAHGISPFDDRILAIKARLMDTIKKEGDVGEERELLEEIRQQALQEIRAGNTKDRGKLVSLAVKAGMSLANVLRSCLCAKDRCIMRTRRRIPSHGTRSSYGPCDCYYRKINGSVLFQELARRSTGDGYQINMIVSIY
jgi:hypothetical protein